MAPEEKNMDSSKYKDNSIVQSEIKIRRYLGQMYEVEERHILLPSKLKEEFDLVSNTRLGNPM